MEDHLKFVLTQVTEWLRFGEAKNGVVVAASGATVFGLLQGAKIWDPSSPWRTGYLVMMAICVALAGFTSLVALLPKTKIPFLMTMDAPRDTDNPLFFGDINKYSPEAYLHTLSKSLGHQPPPTAMERWIAEQIVVNARIACFKYKCFTVALFFMLTAISTPLVSGALLVFLDEGRKPGAH